MVLQIELVKLLCNLESMESPFGINGDDNGGGKGGAEAKQIIDELLKGQKTSTVSRNCQAPQQSPAANSYKNLAVFFNSWKNKIK